jgi:hypothetical protein
VEGVGVGGAAKMYKQKNEELQVAFGDLLPHLHLFAKMQRR